MRPLLLCLLACHLPAGEDVWHALLAAIDDSQPQTAAARADEFAVAAWQRGDDGLLVLAVGTQALLAGWQQDADDPHAAAFTRLQTQRDELPPTARPMADLLLVQWLWLFERQQTHPPAPTALTNDDADFRAWDGYRLRQEIDRRLTALLAEPSLKTTSIERFAGMLRYQERPYDDGDRNGDHDPDPAPQPDPALRPTLYDWLAHQALAFYERDEALAPPMADAFVVHADSPIFADVATFRAWRHDSSQQRSSARIAIRICQDLLAFHQDDADPSAFLHADLTRLRLGHLLAMDDDDYERYRAALADFATRHAGHRLMAAALAEIAWLDVSDTPARALAAAQRGAAAYPGTDGGDRCLSALHDLHQPELALRVPRHWQAPWPAVQVEHRHVTRLHLRAYAISAAEVLDPPAGSLLALMPSEGVATSAPLQLAGFVAVRTWQIDLPPTPDCVPRTTPTPVPTDLPPGNYLLIVSTGADLGTSDQQWSATPFTVSRCLPVLRNRYGPTPDQLVVDGETGEPLAGITVRQWRLPLGSDDLRFALHATATSDADGRLHLPDWTRGDRLTFIDQGTEIAGPTAPMAEREAHWQPDIATVLTDRALYRPGDQVRFKVICHRRAAAREPSQPLAAAAIRIALRDAHGTEVQHTTLITNAFGSASDVFTIPASASTGSWNVQASLAAEGDARIQVEEYRRPRFQVTCDAPPVGVALGQAVRMQGQATTYAGAVVDDALVRWRVSRASRTASWCWSCDPVVLDEVDIAHGATRTDAAGRFACSFTARPAPTGDAHHFVLHVDVTDRAGETRSGSRELRLAACAVVARITAADWQATSAPAAFAISLTTSDDQPVTQAATLVIHPLQQPLAVRREPDAVQEWRDNSWRDSTHRDDDAREWPTLPAIATHEVVTAADGRASISVALPAGIYRAVLTARDANGRVATGAHVLRVIDPAATTWPVREACRVAVSTDEVAVGGTWRAVWGSGHATARAFVEIDQDDRTLRSYWTPAGHTQAVISVPITDDLRGGFTLRITCIRDGICHFEHRHIAVPWTAPLTARWERQPTLLAPGAEATWRLRLSDHDGQPVVAEVAALAYDAALDAIVGHDLPAALVAAADDRSHCVIAVGLGSVRPQQHGSLDGTHPGVEPVLPYPQLHRVLLGEWLRDAVPGAGRNLIGDRGGDCFDGFGRYGSGGCALFGAGPANGAMLVGREERALPPGNAPPPQPRIRRPCDPTAFFAPQLVTDAEGAITFTCPAPELLTTWRVLVFAHDRALRSTRVASTFITARDLMIEANPPRCVRQGDALTFTATVTNRSAQALTGRARLTLTDPAGAARDAANGNATPEQPFTVAAGATQACTWTLRIADDAGPLAYQLTAMADGLDDGESGALPVLPRRVVMDTTLPLRLDGTGAHHVELAALLTAAQRPTLRHQQLTVRLTDRPGWLAVQALASLMDYPHDCSEQVFSRYAGNALALHLARTQPAAAEAFAAWRADAPAHPLDRDPSLLLAALGESPWHWVAGAAEREREARGRLFDPDRMAAAAALDLATLCDRLRGSTCWPWFAGGRPDPALSWMIIAGFGRLQQAGIATRDLPVVADAMDGLGAWLAQRHTDLQRRDALANHEPTATEVLALYAYSFFRTDFAPKDTAEAACTALLARGATTWRRLGSRQTQAQLAVALHRFDVGAEAKAGIVAALREQALRDPQQGLRWPQSPQQWQWHGAPIESHVAGIEMLDEVAGDAVAAAEARAWLLLQRRTQDWGSTRATVDACWALLRHGGELAGEAATTTVALGDAPLALTPETPGSCFRSGRRDGADLRPEHGAITITRAAAGTAWGSVHWRWEDDVEHLPTAADAPLTLRVALLRVVRDAAGARLEPVAGPLAVGDEVVRRLTITSDRDLDYVHLRDPRAALFEPLDVLSAWRTAAGLAAYQAPRGTATDWFLPHLPRGTHVIEHRLRTHLRGRCHTGPPRLQCMYAPEFAADAPSTVIEVR